jgi:hypothetical protein
LYLFFPLDIELMIRRLISLLLFIVLSGCSTAVPVKETQLPTSILTLFSTPVTATSSVKDDVEPVSAPVNLSLSIAASVPDSFKNKIELPDGIHLTKPGETVDLLLQPVLNTTSGLALSTWIYAVAAPFPTLIDEVRLRDLQDAWHGNPPEVFNHSPLLVSAGTKAVFDVLWGVSSSAGVKVVEPEKMAALAWSTPSSWALLPFEDIQPRWKVLRVEDQSPLEKQMDVSTYPLTVRFGFTGVPAAIQTASALKNGFQPSTNRDVKKMTVLAMTGTTALVRGIAEKMDQKGILYPAEDIGSWLTSTDLTHISNEVPFYKDCPPAVRRDPRFCSDPAYIQLLEKVGTRIVELTGNHELDWGIQPFLDTLSIYQKEGWQYYGGGRNLEEARQPIKVLDHGNRLAFIGCNPAGPAADWATSDQPGSASCDFESMKSTIAELRQEGYLVIATFQHVEVCTLEPHLAQKADFGKLVEAGAVIVSGSQAHCPQAMAFKDQQFVHYGLGNLFFDQMDMFSRREFVDRHIFYDGRYIGTELLTAMLEDSSRPRPMTDQERRKLLEDAFRASGWIR